MDVRIVKPWRTSHKSIGVDEALDDAQAQKVDTIAVISSGNYITAIKERITERRLSSRLKVVNLVNEPRNNGDLEVQIEQGRILGPGEREEYVLQHLPNAGKVVDYTDFRPRAYALIAKDQIITADRSGRYPDYVSLGVGSGKLFLALAQVIREQGLQTKLVGILPQGENGIFNEGKLVEVDGKLFTKEPFDPQTIADKLCCPFTALRDELLAARDQGHILAQVGNNDFYSAFLYAENTRFPGEPSATAGFMVHDPEFRAKYNIGDDARCLVVHTGYGELLKWAQQIVHMQSPMPPRLRQLIGLPPLTQKELDDVRAGNYLVAKSWARSNMPVGTENYCV